MATTDNHRESLHVEDANGASMPVKGRSTTGALFVEAAGGTLVSEDFDYIDADESGATTDVYVYKNGGSGGTTVATVTVTYTSSTKLVLDNVART